MSRKGKPGAQTSGTVLVNFSRIFYKVFILNHGGSCASICKPNRLDTSSECLGIANDYLASIDNAVHFSLSYLQKPVILGKGWYLLE